MAHQVAKRSQLLGFGIRKLIWIIDGRQLAFVFPSPGSGIATKSSRPTLDFDEEETMLQSMGRKMGALIDRTPKCHPELAGEGIEYSWGCAKNYYRRLQLEEEKEKGKVISICILHGGHRGGHGHFNSTA